MLSNISKKNITKKLVVGVATVALFAPVALGGSKAHASDLDNAFSKENSEKVAQEGAQNNKERDDWAKAHPSTDPDVTNWRAGDHADASVPKSATNPSNDNNQSNDSDNSSSNGSTSNGNGTSSKNDGSNTTKGFKNDKSENVKYPNALKDKKINKRIMKLHKKGFSNKKIAEQLDVSSSIIKRVIK